MQCTLNIDFNLLSANKIIAYKYVVISQKWKDGRLFEFLHDSPQSGEHVNRCLQVPKERCCAKGDCIYSIMYICSGKVSGVPLAIPHGYSK